MTKLFFVILIYLLLKGKSQIASLLKNDKNLNREDRYQANKYNDVGEYIGDDQLINSGNHNEINLYNESSTNDQLINANNRNNINLYNESSVDSGEIVIDLQTNELEFYAELVSEDGFVLCEQTITQNEVEKSIKGSKIDISCDIDPRYLKAGDNSFLINILTLNKSSIIFQTTYHSYNKVAESDEENRLQLPYPAIFTNGNTILFTGGMFCAGGFLFNFVSKHVLINKPAKPTVDPNTPSSLSPRPLVPFLIFVPPPSTPRTPPDTSNPSAVGGLRRNNYLKWIGAGAFVMFATRRSMTAIPTHRASTPTPITREPVVIPVPPSGPSWKDRLRGIIGRLRGLRALRTTYWKTMLVFLARGGVIALKLWRTPYYQQHLGALDYNAHFQTY